MNIAIISPEFPSYNNLGGVATFNYNFCKLLLALNHTVYVYCRQNGSFSSTLELKNVTIVPIEYRFKNKIANFLYSNVFSTAFKSTIRNFLPVSFAIFEWNFFSFLTLQKQKRVIKIDAAFCTDFFSSGFLASNLLSDIRWYQHLHGPVLLFEQFRRQSLDLKVQKFLELVDIKYLNNKKKIAYSKTLIRDIKKIHDIGEISYIKNFIPEKNKIVPSLTTNRDNLVYFGRFEKRKGVDSLVKAFLVLARKNKNVRLFLIGDNIGNEFGEYNNNYLFDYIDLKQIPVDISSRIVCVPRIDNRFFLEKIIRTLNGIVILPARYEPLGFTTVESLLLGQIVVTTRNEDMLIQDGVSGFYCSPSSESILKCVGIITKKSDEELYKIKTNAIGYITKLHRFSTAKAAYKSILENN